MKRFAIIFLLLAAAAATHADELVLKIGKKYKGTISRPRPGKVAVKTKLGKFEFNDSQVSFKHTTVTAPRNAERAFDLLKAKKYAEAQPLFEQWRQRFMGLPVTWHERALYGLGVCLASTGKAAEAAPVFQQLLDDFPETRHRNEAEYWLIELQLAGKPGPELEAKLKSLLVDRRTSDRIRAKAHQGLGAYYNSQGDLRNALEQYVSIVVLYGDIDELQEGAQTACADLFTKLGRTNEATFYYKQIMEAYPESDGARRAEKLLSTLTRDTGE